MGKCGQGCWDSPAEFRLALNFTKALPITHPLHNPRSPSINLLTEFLCSRNTCLKELPFPLMFQSSSPWNPLLWWRKITRKLMAVAVQEQEGPEANGIPGASSLHCQPELPPQGKAPQWLEGNSSGPAACHLPFEQVKYIYRKIYLDRLCAWLTSN